MSKTDSRKIDELVEALHKNRYTDTIDRLRPNSTISINPSQKGFLDIYIEYPNDFLPSLREAVFRVKAQKDGLDKLDLIKSSFSKIKINLIGELVMNMHDINTKHENSTVTFECQVLATDAPKSYVKEAIFDCAICGNEYEEKCNIDRRIVAPVCHNPTCKKAKTMIRTSDMITDDVQTILMQEPMDKSKKSSPVIFTGKLVGELCRTSYVGQKKLITGLFRSDVDLKKNEHDVFIDIMSVQDMDENKPKLPNDDEIKELTSDSKKDGFIDKIINSFAPAIFGYNDIKLSILLQLAGGVKTQKRGDINLFLIGDPSMAKSELLKFASNLVSKSIYTSGRGSSAAGLTIGIVKMSDGRSIAQAGVLPMCDGGLACIDEFDKMGDQDRSAMHEAMEQQTVSIAKAGIAMTLPSRTSVLAAANPKWGMYDSDNSLRDNINVPAPLLSRFDLIWLIQDKVNMTSDRLKANHILDSFEMTMGDRCYLKEDELSKYINYARTFNPKLNEEAKKVLLDIYESMRNVSAKSDIPIGTRQLEAIVRLSMAYAKLHFKEEVEPEDINIIKILLEKQYESFGSSISKGGVQTQIFVDGKSVKEHDVLTVWNSCKNIEGNVKLREFEKALIDSGMSKEKAEATISKWENNNAIKLNGDGTYTRI
jgi:replicative DNA helicase Mcm